MALVSFKTGTLSQYNAATKDANTLYFISDTKQLYKGSVLYTPTVKVVSTDPTSENGEVNTLYVNSSSGRVSFFNGTSVQTVVKAPLAAVGSGSATEFASTKAVVDYVTSKVNDLGVGALFTRLSTAETNIANLQGTVTKLDGAESVTGSVKQQIAAAKTSAANDATAKANAAQTAAEKTAADALSTAKRELNTAIGKKADKATTLAGYGIVNAFTKDETTSAINSAVANAHHLKREIVAKLPEVASANADTIYMVPASGSTDTAGSTSSAYNEYMLINGAFERIGTSDVDLSNYYTKSQADTMAQGKADAALSAAKSDAKSKADAAESNAKTHATNLVNALDVTDTAAKGQYVSAVSQTDGKITVTRASLPAAATLTTGTASGTVKFNGTDVAVKGLGSAAYTASSAYATAAQGTKADSALQAASIKTGTANGTISVAGSNVSVFGLGSAAYTAASAYDAAGAANTALASAKSYAEGLLTWGTL